MGSSAAEVRDELDRILASPQFRGAESQRRFLTYSVSQTLSGYRDRIKEYTIGIEVFERGESFDPRLDPIVRTQASKLRARLARYYETLGAGDPLRIELPRGSYAPVF